MSRGRSSRSRHPPKSITSDGPRRKRGHGGRGGRIPRVEGARERRRKAISSRASKGSITKMIGSAIGGDVNCVNGVIITNLEAISSRPDQSEDAPPFPEPGPSSPPVAFPPSPSPRPVHDGNRIFEQLVFKSREPFAAPSTSTSSSPSSPSSPLHFPPSSLCATLVSLLSSPSGYTQDPLDLVGSAASPCPLSPSLPLLIARNDDLCVEAERHRTNFARRSFLAFARNNDLFYDSDFSPFP